MTEPVWIDERDGLALHDRLLALHGGAAGLRDDGLLKSALARPQQHFAYGESPDTIDMATRYTAGIVHNHPFVDGNKRTAFVTALTFLRINGFGFRADAIQGVRLREDLALGGVTVAAFAAWFQKRAETPSGDTTLRRTMVCHVL